MRTHRLSLLSGATLAALSLPAQAGQNSERSTAAVPPAESCKAPAAAQKAEEEAAGPPVFYDGLGYAGIVPDTQDAEARRWFEQGVRLIWAYDEVEAVRAFQAAQQLDAQCAMCFWGEAWARGPTLNLQPRTEEHGAASAAVAKAAALSGKLGPRDKALVEAMRLRVSGKQDFNGKAYRKAMARLAKRYPADDAVLVMAADAQIIVGAEKGIKPGTDAQKWLETVLRRHPDHSGAIHLYIHLTDFTDQQKLAEPYADRLGRLAPGASHLVHMPSHTFFGVGRYGDAAAANVKAMEADRAFVATVKPVKSGYRTALYAHNNHFAIQSTLMRGDGATALKSAADYAARYPASEDRGFRAIIRAASWYAAGLHAPVESVLKMEAPEGAISKAMRLYARGEAQARAGNVAGVRAEAAALAAFRAGPDGRALGAKSVESLVEMTEQILVGRAAMIVGDHAAAQIAYRKAMTLQEGAGFGSDPPPFWYPVRRSLAAALLAGGDAEGAKRQLVASLEAWPRDPLGLYLLGRAEEALGNRATAADHLRRAQAEWAGEIAQVPLARI
jgi:tetratricopeptide (TPR) repeat protein